MQSARVRGEPQEMSVQNQNQGEARHISGRGRGSGQHFVGSDSQKSKKKGFQKLRKNDESAGLSPLMVASIISFKKIDVRTLSLISGCPEANVLAYLSGSARALNKKARQLVLGAAGIDFASGGLRSDVIHVFRLDGLSPTRGALDRVDANNILRLIHGSVVAKVSLQKNGYVEKAAWSNTSVFALQSESIRAIIVANEYVGARFKPESTSGCKWVCGTKLESSVKSSMSMKQVIDGDITASEFDDIFSENSGLTWSDVALAARIGGLTKSDVMGLIEGVRDVVDLGNSQPPALKLFTFKNQ